MSKSKVSTYLKADDFRRLQFSYLLGFWLTILRKLVKAPMVKATASNVSDVKSFVSMLLQIGVNEAWKAILAKKINF